MILVATHELTDFVRFKISFHNEITRQTSGLTEFLEKEKNKQIWVSRFGNDVKIWKCVHTDELINFL